MQYRFAAEILFCCRFRLDNVDLLQVLLDKCSFTAGFATERLFCFRFCLEKAVLLQVLLGNCSFAARNLSGEPTFKLSSFLWHFRVATLLEYLIVEAHAFNIVVDIFDIATFAVFEDGHLKDRNILKTKKACIRP